AAPANGAPGRQARRFCKDTTVRCSGPLVVMLTSSTKARMMSIPRPDSGSAAMSSSLTSASPAWSAGLAPARPAPSSDRPSVAGPGRRRPGRGGPPAGAAGAHHRGRPRPGAAPQPGKAPAGEPLPGVLHLDAASAPAEAGHDLVPAARPAVAHHVGAGLGYR